LKLHFTESDWKYRNPNTQATMMNPQKVKAKKSILLCDLFEQPFLLLNGKLKLDNLQAKEKVL
jgi:glutamine synthetase type III